MLNMLRIAATSYGISRFKQRVQQSVAYVIAIATGAVIAAIGVMYLLNALWSYLAYAYGPVAAGSILGSGLIIIAVILTSVMLIIQKRNAKKPVIDVQGALASLSNRIPPKMASQQGLKTLGLLVGMGYLIGRNLFRK